jgi:NHLM bacteriocin system ABC transporter ATP-binding protein
MATALSPPSHGGATTTDGRSPIVLQTPNALLTVDSGQVNLFIELLGGDEEIGRDERPTVMRQFLCSAQSGDCIPIPSVLPQNLRLVAVGVGHAEVTLLEQGDESLKEATHLDEVIEAVSHLANDSKPMPPTWSVLPGTKQKITKPQLLSAHRLAWVYLSDTDSDSTASKAQESDLPAPVYPVSPTLSLQVDSGTTIDVKTSAETLNEFGFILVDYWINPLFAQISTLLQRRVKDEEQRLLKSRQNEQALISSTHQEMSSIISRNRGETFTSHADRESSVRMAIVSLCDAENITIDPDKLNLDDEAAAADFQQYLRQVGLRSRRVTLQQQWWLQDSSSFIAFDKEDNSPVAVIREKSGKFSMRDPQSGLRKVVNAQAAATLSEGIYVVYRPLPHHALTAFDLIKHVFASSARADMKWAAGLAFMIALLGLITPIITGKIFNEVIPYAETDRLLQFGLGLIIMALGTAVFQAVRAIALLRVQSVADGTLQAAVWDRLLHLPLTFFRRFQVGELMIKAMGPAQLRQALSDTVLSSLLAAIFSLVNFALMMTYDASLALVALGFSVISGIILFSLSYSQLRIERDQLKSLGAVSSFILQILFGINKIRLAGAENRSYALWLKKFSNHRLKTFKAENIANLSGTINQTLPVLASVLFFTTVGFSGDPADGGISVGDYLAFSAAFGMFQGAMLTFVSSLSTSLAAIPIYENMKPLLDELPETTPDQKAPGELSGLIELNNVSFRYQEDGPLILDNLSLKIEAGKFVAIVGPSGSGKSTIFRLLLGFEKPASGSVSLDGNNLSELDLRLVRRQLGVVLQRGAILPGSLYENIVGSSAISQDGAWEAARMAGFDEEIRDMPMGMHTVLSDGGGALSGGQRQRLMIARAVVSQPQILLMDEATSALDNRTQSIVSEALQHLNATRVVIAHRLSTVIDADCIYVVDAGRVVQSGTYEELLNTEGVFQTIAKPQLS